MGGSNISQSVSGRPVHFCCPGCLYVFQILFNSPEGICEDYKNTELYKACVQAGLIPPEAGGGPEGAGEPVPPEVGSPEIDEIREGLSRELSLRIEGMWCVACSWLIEQLLRKMDGVLSAGIFFFSDIARIKYMPHRLDPQQIIDAISRLGYRAVPVEKASDSGESRSFVVRLGVSAILGMNIMMISLALYYGFFEDLGREGAAYFVYPMWAMATPAIFYGGWPILRGAFHGLRHGTPTMDALIAAGVLSAYIYSLVQMVRGGHHVYFDTASMLVTLVLLGRFIELRAREKISAGITSLFHAASGKARLLSEGREVWTAAEKVRLGDPFSVLPGERVPVDGRIVSGRAVVDESLLTGESRPLKKGPGAEVPAGALLLDGEVRLEAVRPGNESALAQVIALIEEALSSKNRIEMFADRAMRVLVPGMLLLAGAVAAFLLARSVPADQALLRALTVLVITCPCALGIATPLARVAAISRARALGILVRNPAALERVEGLDAVVFDKTGTITEGRYRLREIAAIGGSEDDALRRVAAVEAGSDHFLAREIVRAARRRSLEPEEALSVEPVEGLGVVGRIRAGEVAVGNRGLMARRGLAIPEELERRARLPESAGATVVFFAWDGSVRGFLVFGDRVRESAAKTISRLRADGISVLMVSGDSQETARAVARDLGIEDVVGQALPQDKVRIVRELQERGMRVAMAGDGINDAAALASADIGITIGSGANLIRECADAAVFGDDLEKVAELFALSRHSFRITRQNLFFAFFYNLLGIPLAAAGLLNPFFAACAMFASSITVIGNTLRISRFVP